MTVVVNGETIEVRLDRETEEKLSRIFARVQGATPTDLAAEVISLAFKEWIGWLSAEDRPMSIIDQNITRVLSLYEAIYPSDIPDAQRLYNDFSLPLGQARYIAQAIGYKQGTYLQRLALEAVLRELHRVVSNWQGRPAPERDEQQELVLILPRSSEREYQEAVADLAAANQIAPPKATARALNLLYYPIETAQWNAIAVALLTRLGRLAAEAPARITAECPTLREATV